MLYSRKNVAKQWIYSEVDRLAEGRDFKLCDLACGYGSGWPDFLKDHPQIAYLGIDTDKKEIARAEKAFGGLANARVSVGDAQMFRDNNGNFDVVTAFSALEHVVDLAAFVKTVLALLKPGGVAYLNYDAGHFRSSNPKERMMVPVSQLLAKIGIEGPYMKEVDDSELTRIVEGQGAKVKSLFKFNGRGIKELANSEASDEAVRAWHDFEFRLNGLVPSKTLDKIFWSTVMVVEKT
jgi:SAM-dependent methyltransferase